MNKYRDNTESVEYKAADTRLKLLNSYLDSYNDTRQKLADGEKALSEKEAENIDKYL
jgi:hypothetical protein